MDVVVNRVDTCCDMNERSYWNPIMDFKVAMGNINKARKLLYDERC